MAGECPIGFGRQRKTAQVAPWQPGSENESSTLRSMGRALSQFPEELQQFQPLVLRKAGCFLHCRRVFLKGFGDEITPFGRELDEAHAPVIGRAPLYELLCLQ